MNFVLKGTIIERFLKIVQTYALPIFTLLVASLAIIFRYRYLNTYMTEYDDIGIVNLPLSIPAGNYVLQDPLEYAYHIGLSWTYPPAQYLITSMLWHGQADLSILHPIARLVTASISVINVTLVGLIGYYLNNKKFTVNTLLITSLISLSFFQISYGYHAGPYGAMLTTCLIITYLLIWYSRQQKRWSIVMILLAAGALTYFNYLVALLMPGLVLAMLASDTQFVFSIKKIWENIKKRGLYYITGIVLYFITIQPILATFLKTDRGMHGKWLWQNSGGNFLTTISEWITNLVSQTYSIFHNLVNFSYNLAGPLEYLLYGLLLITAVSGWIYSFTQKEYRAVGILNTFYLIIWILLHSLRKIPFDETRHLIVLLPIFLIGIHATLNKFYAVRWVRWFITFIPIGIVLLFLITQNTFFSERITKFDYSVLKNQTITNDVHLIITDIYTLQPFQLPYEISNLKVYMLDGMYKDQYGLPSTITNDTRFKTGNIIYISQQKSINAATESDLVKHGKQLQNKLEVMSKDIYFAPNNTSSNSVANGFYLYVYR